MVRIAVIGGGLVGLGTALALRRRDPRCDVVVLEKEAGFGRHQSTHNSGVLHAGIYYKPGSAKARLAVRGIREMTAFCAEHGVRHEIVGKLVVAVSDDELPRLQALWERGNANGLRGLRMLSAAQAAEIEPHVRCVRAIHVPEEGIVDYAGVVNALVEQLIRVGVALHPLSGVMALRAEGRGWAIDTTSGAYHADFIVNCAGLHCDRVAEMAGERPEVRIVPFRGEYFVLRPEKEYLVHNLIYPVPDPRFPFLGVHFTRMIKGGIECGPNAVLATAREGYTRYRFSARDMWDEFTFPGVWRFVARYPRMTMYEVARSLRKSLFARSLQRMIPDVRESDLTPGGSGVRAQAMRPDGTTVEDFLYVKRANALHLLNAPSPGATASLAIGDEIAGTAIELMKR
jgi:L-2-hydroxyglutarate oxidase